MITIFKNVILHTKRWKKHELFLVQQEQYDVHDKKIKIVTAPLPFTQARTKGCKEYYRGVGTFSKLR